MDLKEIQSLIKFVAKSGANEVKLEMEDVKITIKTGGEKTETTIVQSAPMAMGQMPVMLLHQLYQLLLLKKHQLHQLLILVLMRMQTISKLSRLSSELLP